IERPREGADKESIGSGARSTVIHPLVQRNTSDLREQRYSSRFSGEEFFLADHRVGVNGADQQKVLPGVAYLEMARVAVEEACPDRPGGSVLELRNVVWAQPLVVEEEKEVHIALSANEEEEEEIEYEIYSQAGGAEVVHCQGCAVWREEWEQAAWWD